MMQPDIGEALVGDMGQRLRHTVDEGLRTDKAVIGQQIGTIGEMLTPAEADLEMQRARIAEQHFARHRAFGRHRNLRQEGIDQPLLILAQLLPDRAAIKPRNGGRIAFLERCHGAGAWHAARRGTRKSCWTHGGALW